MLGDRFLLQIFFPYESYTYGEYRLPMLFIQNTTEGGEKMRFFTQYINQYQMAYHFPIYNVWAISEHPGQLRSSVFA